jgi:hypothetical protein
MSNELEYVTDLPSLTCYLHNIPFTLLHQELDVGPLCLHLATAPNALEKNTA